MSFAFNKVIIGGNLTRDVDMRYTPSGSAVCEFGVAINEGTAEKPETVFVDVTVWGKTAEHCNQYLTKGSAVLIESKLKYDQWEDKNGGGKRSKLSVLAQRVQFINLGKKDDKQEQVEQPEAQSRYNPDDFVTQAEAEIIEDEDLESQIPF